MPALQDEPGRRARRRCSSGPYSCVLGQWRGARVTPLTPVFLGVDAGMLGKPYPCPCPFSQHLFLLFTFRLYYLYNSCLFLFYEFAHMYVCACSKCMHGACIPEEGIGSLRTEIQDRRELSVGAES